MFNCSLCVVVYVSIHFSRAVLFSHFLFQWLGDVNNEQLIQYNAYCQAVGAMVGAALGAMGADQAGRRRPLYVYFPLMLIAHCLSGFAVSWTMLAVFRFLVGMFAGGILLSTDKEHFDK